MSSRWVVGLAFDAWEAVLGFRRLANRVSNVHGLDLISQNRLAADDITYVKSFYHVDGLGSTRALSSIGGLITDRYDYDAYGRTIGKVGNTANLYLFAGEQRDSHIGLDYLRTRYLDVASGRFVSRDAFSGFVATPITLNRYVYANANPATLVDPTGRFGLIDVIGLSVLGAVGGYVWWALRDQGFFGFKIYLELDRLGQVTASSAALGNEWKGISLERIYYAIRRSFLPLKIDVEWGSGGIGSKHAHVQWRDAGRFFGGSTPLGIARRPGVEAEILLRNIDLMVDENGLDSDAISSVLALVARHELGHSFSLDHKGGFIMREFFEGVPNTTKGRIDAWKQMLGSAKNNFSTDQQKDMRKHLGNRRQTVNPGMVVPDVSHF